MFYHVFTPRKFRSLWMRMGKFLLSEAGTKYWLLALETMSCKYYNAAVSSLQRRKWDAMSSLMRYCHTCGGDRSSQGCNVRSLLWLYKRRTTPNVMQTFHYLAHSPPVLSCYLDDQCFQRIRISFEWERCKCFEHLCGRLNSRDEWLSCDQWSFFQN